MLLLSVLGKRDILVTDKQNVEEVLIIIENNFNNDKNFNFILQHENLLQR